MATVIGKPGRSLLLISPPRDLNVPDTAAQPAGVASHPGCIHAELTSGKKVFRFWMGASEVTSSLTQQVFKEAME